MSLMNLYPFSSSVQGIVLRESSFGLLSSFFISPYICMPCV
uniref:Uncharacterized protein n=1 Tax=Arundo donax TaxID=35708 RepID=A0A0A9H0D1_ARUDO